MATFVETLVVGVRYQIDMGSLAVVTRSFKRSAASLSSAASKIADISRRSLGVATAQLGATASVLGDVAGAAVVASVALGGFAINQALTQDATAKMAAALNTTTEELTALEFAADRSGISSSQLTTTLERLNRGATKAAQDGASPAAKAFRDLGISARDAAGDLKSPAELLPEIAQGLLGVTDTGRQSEIQIELLGRSALRMGALLGQGSRGIKDLTDQAADFGAVISSEAAANSEAFVDSLTNLKSTSAALGRQLGDALIPHLTKAFGATAEWLKTSDNFVRVGMARTIAALTVTLAALQTPLGQAVAGTVALAGSAKILEKIALRLGISLGVVTLPVAAVGAVVAVAVLAIDDLIVTMQGGDSVIRRMADSLGVGEEAVTILGASAEIATDLIAVGFIAAKEAVLLTIDGIAETAMWMGELVDVASVAFPALKGVAVALTAIGDAVSSIPNLPNLLLAQVPKIARGFEEAAEVTGRLRTGDLTEEETGKIAGAFGASSQSNSKIGTGVATLLESSAQRRETGAGFGLGRAVTRNEEIRSLGTSDRVRRGDIGGAINLGGRSSFADVQEGFGGGFGNDFTDALLGSGVSGALDALLNPGGESRAAFGAAGQLAGQGASTQVDLVISAGASFAEMARQAGAEVERTLLAQESAITDAS